MVTRSYDHEYSCVSCTGASKHSFINKETITVIIGDESKPDITPVLADGSCAVILRYAELTVEVLNDYKLGPLFSKGSNWTERGNYGMAELLLKVQDQGGKVIFFYRSGTELVEGLPDL